MYMTFVCFCEETEQNIKILGYTSSKKFTSKHSKNSLTRFCYILSIPVDKYKNILNELPSGKNLNSSIYNAYRFRFNDEILFSSHFLTFRVK